MAESKNIKTKRPCNVDAHFVLTLGVEVTNKALFIQSWRRGITGR